MKQEEFYDFIVRIIKGIIKFYVIFLGIIFLIAIFSGIIIFLIGR